MTITPLPRSKGWMKLRGWASDVWNFLSNITELLAAVGSAATDSKTYNVRIVVKDKEYSQRLPDATTGFDLKVTDGTAIRWAFEKGRVAGAKRPYNTLAQNELYYKERLNLVGKTIYFACSTETPMVELICWI
ncbi:unnamed protein product [marine sediment metagenome]|uniref:Uncharacterized protein n=1 Tax=marine sediment metagenome TaxID=412755 RepID=X1E5X7_9ZZZZ